MDAIQRWLNSAHSLPGLPGKKSKSKSRKTFIVPKDAHADIERAFRFTQRCRDPQDFKSYLNAFESAIQQVCLACEVVEQCEPICQYFRDNFWSGDWRGKHINFIIYLNIYSICIRFNHRHWTSSWCYSGPNSQHKQLFWIFHQNFQIHHFGNAAKQAYRYSGHYPSRYDASLLSYLARYSSKAC